MKISKLLVAVSSLVMIASVENLTWGEVYNSYSHVRGGGYNQQFVGGGRGASPTRVVGQSGYGGRSASPAHTPYASSVAGQSGYRAGSGQIPLRPGYERNQIASPVYGRNQIASHGYGEVFRNAANKVHKLGRVADAFGNATTQSVNAFKNVIPTRPQQQYGGGGRSPTHTSYASSVAGQSGGYDSYNSLGRGGRSASPANVFPTGGGQIPLRSGHSLPPPANYSINGTDPGHSLPPPANYSINGTDPGQQRYGGGGQRFNGGGGPQFNGGGGRGGHEQYGGGQRFNGGGGRGGHEQYGGGPQFNGHHGLGGRHR